MPSETAAPSCVPPLWPLLALCAAVAVWIGLSAGACHHNGDSLIPVLVSLQRWTPFYWDQDRLGMLVPLLAMPLRDPFVNLLVQQTVCLFAGLAALVLLARYALRGPAYPAVALVSAAAFVGLAPEWYRQIYFVHPYCSLWLALGLGALVAAEFPGGAAPSGWRRAPRDGRSALAHWVYSPTALLLGPLVVVRRWLCGGAALPEPPPQRGRVARLGRWLWFSETGFALVVVAFGVAVGVAAMQAVSQPRTDLATLSTGKWGYAAWQFLRNSWLALAPHHWTAFVWACGGLGLFLLAAPRWRRAAPAGLKAAAVLATAALPYGLFMATRRWSAANEFDCRYVVPCVTLMAAALVTLGVAPLWAAAGRLRRALAPVAALLLLAAAYRSYGLPTVAGAREHLDRTLGALTEDLLAARCTHVAGSYWTVWPAVYHVNLVLHERGEPRTVWGVTGRSRATWRQLRRVPAEELRVGVPPGDAAAEGFLREYGFAPVELVEKRPTVWVYRPAGGQAQAR